MKRYTTKELEFITNNIELFKKELKNRQIKELYNFPFKVGDVVHTKNDVENSFIKIKKIDEINNNIIVDEIIIRGGGFFNAYVDEWYKVNYIGWHEYFKIEESEIFENLLEIINKYIDDIQQLKNDTYLKLKNEIATLDSKTEKQ